MEDEETRTELTRMIAELPQEQRELLSLTLDGGLNSQQVGAVLGKSAVAVRVQLHRTIERLRQQFSQMSKESNR
jgi:RNA polymerase sigma factor (sigma-70 family)